MYLTFVVDREANYSSSLNGWSGDFIIQTFGRQALPMLWDYAESNPFSNSTRNWSGAISWVIKSLEKLPVTGSGIAQQFDAQSDCRLRDINGTASSSWETMLSAIINAGFLITGTWPMHTERETGLKASVNALITESALPKKGPISASRSMP